MSPLPTDGELGASFRDPSGYLFRSGGELFRLVSQSYREDYQHLLASGLYRSLVEDRLLIPHREIDPAPPGGAPAFKVIQPDLVPIISYPYEWCFSQLRDAALATLAIQAKALEHGMVLKDASAYNIQFHRGRPILIDTLSFARYREGEPWTPYRQFCQHFLAPLALMSRCDVRLGQLSRIHIDGVPLDLASALLPARTRLSWPLLLHLHLHARAQRRSAARPLRGSGRKMSRLALRGLVASLASAVEGSKWQAKGTPWADYYEDTNYSARALDSKRALVAEGLDLLKPALVWDLGANTGLFSRLASRRGCLTVSCDSDPVAVERNYAQCVRENDTNILPLVLDLANPSPDLGWDNRERESWSRRGPADAVLALALVHHLAIAGNVPLRRLSEYFRRVGRSLIIEFVPKDDSQVRRLLQSREDIFPDYTRECFEREFGKNFLIRAARPVEESRRIIYVLQGRSDPR